jgi:hypothetical protein
MGVEKEHQAEAMDRIGLSPLPGMNDLIKMVFKLPAPVNVLRRLLKKRVKLIWFYPYND